MCRLSIYPTDRGETRHAHASLRPASGDQQTGRPIGGGLAFGRELAHVLDGFFYIGYLWPLWDAKRQTFADKVCGTVGTTRR